MLDRNYRLPVTVQARRYAPVLRVNRNPGTFEGQMELTLELLEATDTIRLHALELDVVEAKLADGTAASLSVDEASETIGLKFPQLLPPGEVTLELSWSGTFCAGLRGLYRAGDVAVTQFEAADCRRVFPSLDEPAFKACWQITLSGVDLGDTALSNGAVVSDTAQTDGTRTVVFAETPPLSSYLVALVIGELSGCEAEDVRGVATRTFSVPDKHHLQAFGQMCAVKSLPLLEDYFGLPYIFGKLDQVGIPDFEAGAMENAGCITYRETALLLDPDTAPLRIKKIVAEIVTHELAHQWFGNLVTMVWWDDLWLNEAFATWMAYKIVDKWEPGWRMWMDFEVGKQAAYSLDALQSSHPIRSEVQNATEAGEAFDAITYEKGGAVLHMIEGYIGEDAFREGIARYMERHQKQNAVADDLWRALAEASDAPLLELANNWIRRTGFPLVSVVLDAEKGRVHLSQRRFFSDPDASEAPDATPWLVPLVLRYEDDTGIREHRVVFSSHEQLVTPPAHGELRWCLANADARGFFRTAYDAGTFAALRTALPRLKTVERMCVVSDLWALIKCGEAEVEQFLELAVALSDERDHVVLDEVVSVLAALEYRHVHDDDRAAFRTFVAELFAPAAAELTLTADDGDDDARRLTRAAVARARVLVAHAPDDVAAARELFSQLLGGDDAAPPFDPNLLDVVVTAGARNADPKTFKRLQRRASHAVDPAARRRYLHALARVEDPALAREAVALSLTDAVPLQDFSGFTSALLRNQAAREAAWTNMQENSEAVLGRLGAPMIRTRFVESLAALITAEHLQQVEAFLKAHPMEGTTQAAQQTLERLRLEVSLRARIAPALGAYLKNRVAKK